MDLLTSSGSSVTAAAAGKAVRTWAVQRPFGGFDNGQFAVCVDGHHWTRLPNSVPLTPLLR